MNISGTTSNFAIKRNLEITEQTVLNEDGTETSQVWLWESDNDDEPLVIFKMFPLGGIVVEQNIYLKEEIYNDIPKRQMDENLLRRTIDYISKTL